MADALFASFDQVRIINLVDRPDRRREMAEQLLRLKALGPNVGFFDARRPSSPGDFPSLGARGCFESHLTVLRGARDEGARSLLLVEDDFDFTRDGSRRVAGLLDQLFSEQWDFFYGAHMLPNRGRAGLAPVPADEAVLTASFVGFGAGVIHALVDFLEGITQRPAGSPEYGPMHVDGAYGIFRQLHPQYRTFAAFPPLGKQRSSPSDITPSGMILDQWLGTRGVAKMLRRGYNALARR